MARPLWLDRVPDRERRFPALRGTETVEVAVVGGGINIGRHRRYFRYLFALGYGGNGMTFGFLAARLLFEMQSGGTRADHELFAFTRQRRKA